MLTGKRLFDGESVAETLGLIFSKEPDPAALPPGTPPALRSLVARCLVRDPRQRLRDIGDGRQVLDDIMAGRTDGSLGRHDEVATAPATALRRSGWPLIIAALVIALGGWGGRLARAAGVPVLRFSIALPPGERVTGTPAISPDGQRFFSVRIEPDSQPMRLNVIVNWFEELKKVR
jgi:hypothetical protein